jgi:hypothetical protein
LGSSFAGVKAGIIAGIFFAAATGIFNYLLLLATKAATLSVLAQTPECMSVVSTNSTNPLEECFSTVTSVLVPFVTFEIFIVALIFGFIFGRFFDRFPLKGYLNKALVVSYVMILVILFLGIGISADSNQRLILTLFDLLVAAGFAYLLALFYKRYTRVVEFSSTDIDPVKILIRGRNVTGKAMTFSNRSSQKVVAEASGSRVFREWSYSGGVTVEDPKSFETVMRVEGNGILKAYSTTPI